MRLECRNCRLTSPLDDEQARVFNGLTHISDAYEARGRVFESPRAYHPFNNLAFRLASWAPFGLHPAAVTGLWWPRGKPNPKPPGRKAGRAYGRRACRPIPPRLDERIDVALPKRCPRCGGGVELERRAPQYQEEIVRRTVARRFDIAVGRCRRCGRRVQGRYPLQTSDAVGVGSVQLGPEALTLATAGRGRMDREHKAHGQAIKDIYVYPLVRDARQRLCGELER